MGKKTVSAFKAFPEQRVLGEPPRDAHHNTVVLRGGEKRLEGMKFLVFFKGGL